MDPIDRQFLREYIEGLEERDVWALLVDYFAFRGMRANVVHSTGEHGMDVVVFVDASDDILNRGFNILIQAKTGALGLGRWRNSILYQILELPYYRIPHPNYIDHLSRRLLLVVTGTIALEARNSIDEYNKKHDVTLEVWELDDILSIFDKSGFATQKLEQIRGVGQPEEIEIPPVVGEALDG